MYRQNILLIVDKVYRYEKKTTKKHRNEKVNCLVANRMRTPHSNNVNCFAICTVNRFSLTSLDKHGIPHRQVRSPLKRLVSYVMRIVSTRTVMT